MTFLHIRCIALIFSLVFLLFGNVSAQISASSLRFSGGGEVNFLSYSANFNELPGFPKPPSLFNSGKGFGFSLNSDVEIPLWSPFGIGLRAIFQHFDGTLSADEQTTISDDEGNPIAGIIRHSLDCELSYAALEPRLTMKFSNAMTLKIGANVAFPLSSYVEQTQKIIEPQDAEIISGAKPLTGEIPSLSSPLLSLTFGISYGFPIDARHSWFVEPEISYRQGLSNLVSTVAWTSSSLALGISLVYASEKPKKILRDTIYRRDTTTKFSPLVHAETTVLLSQFFEEEPPLSLAENVLYRTVIRELYSREIPKSNAILTAGLSARFFTKEGKEQTSFTLRMDRSSQTTSVFALPFVFFEYGLAEIPARFTQKNWDKSTIEHISSENFPLSALRSTLALTGNFLQKSPRSVLTLTPSFSADENEADALAERRAQAIKTYLVEHYGIVPSRINVRPSATAQDDRVESLRIARRVELSFEKDFALPPLVRNDSGVAEHLPSIRFYPDIFSEIGVREWRVKIASDGKIVKTLEGNADVRMLSWNVSDEPSALSLIEKPLECWIEVSDNDGQTQESGHGRLIFDRDSTKESGRTKIHELFYVFAKNSRATENIAEILPGGKHIKILAHTESEQWKGIAHKKLGISNTEVQSRSAILSDDTPEGEWFNHYGAYIMIER